MTKITVSKDLLKRLVQSAEDAGDLEAAEQARKLLPIPLPTEVGTVIMWREKSSVAGKDVGVFAERVDSEGVLEWRHNGFDLYSDRAMEIELSGKTWWIMEPKK